MAGLNDRGQMLLIGAITIAVLFISLSIVLNGSLHTPEVAAEASEDVSVGDQGTFHSSVRQNTITLMDRAATVHPGDTSAQTEYIADNASVIADSVARFYAEEDRILSIEVDSSDIITSTERGFGLDEVAPADTETIVSDRFSRFELETPSPGDFDNPIFVTVQTIDGASYEVEISNDPGDQLVTVGEVGGPQLGTCDGSPDSTRVDFADATVNGDPCAALDVISRSEPNRVQIDENQNDPSAVQYWKMEANDGNDEVYGVEVTVIEQSPDLHYDRVIRVAPEEVR